MKSRLIKISKNKIYFTNDFYINLSQTNFPDNSISFRHHVDYYLEVELLNYSLYNEILELRITDYSVKDRDLFYEQKLKKPVSQLVFKELEWTKLTKLLSSYLVDLPYLIPEAFKKGIQIDSNTQKRSIKKAEEKTYENEENQEVNKDELEVKTYNEIFKVPYSEAEFCLGYISVIKVFRFSRDPIEFKITNDFILSEYDYIKNYFSNYYRSDSFAVSATIKTKGDEILSIDCHSKIIENIDEKIIENVKTNRTLNLIKVETSSEKEKAIYTADEILSRLDASNNVFDQSEIEILNAIIESKSPRNEKQLIYLSGEKHERTQKIRFTLHPLFGFVFFISGEKRNHFCWELLNSHATYLWSFEKDQSIEYQIELSELNINTIKIIGRKEYRSRIRNKQININSIFSVINHSKSKSKNDFEIWRNKLISKLN